MAATTKIRFFAFVTAAVTIRPARPEDCPAILALIVELAVYEKAENEVELTAEDLRRDAFGENPCIGMIVAEQADPTANDAKAIIGTAIHYEKYSTWKGRSLHLEDIVVKASHRRKGVGSLLFEAVIRFAAEGDYARMDWQVLDWNAPAIAFYKKYGAEISDEWLNGRFDREGLKKAKHHGGRL